MTTAVQQPNHVPNEFCVFCTGAGHKPKCIATGKEKQIWAARAPSSLPTTRYLPDGTGGPSSQHRARNRAVCNYFDGSTSITVSIARAASPSSCFCGCLSTAIDPTGTVRYCVYRANPPCKRLHDPLDRILDTQQGIRSPSLAISIASQPCARLQLRTSRGRQRPTLTASLRTQLTLLIIATAIRTLWMQASL